MKVLVLGAGGRTGFHVVTQALAAGHTVTGLVRDRAQLRLGDRRLHVVVGDARNVADLIEVVQGQDLIISALGTLKAGDKLQARAMEAVLAAMHAGKVRRLVILSSLLNTPNYRSSGWQKLVDLALKKVHEDKRDAERTLRQSDVDWTIVYGTVLTNVSSREWRPIKPTQTVSLADRLPREAAACALLSLAGNRRAVRKSLLISGV